MGFEKGVGKMGNEIKATEEHLQFLDDLNKSRIYNIFMGAEYLHAQFPELTKAASRQILSDWKKSFKKRHKSNSK